LLTLRADPANRYLDAMKITTPSMACFDRRNDDDDETLRQKEILKRSC